MMDGCTFAPHVSDTSRSIASTFSTDADVPAWQRLSTEPSKGKRQKRWKQSGRRESWQSALLHPR